VGKHLSRVCGGPLTPAAAGHFKFEAPEPEASLFMAMREQEEDE